MEVRRPGPRFPVYPAQGRRPCRGSPSSLAAIIRSRSRSSRASSTDSGTRRLGILWLDAHPDLCDEYAGSRLSHACVLRRGLEAGLQPAEYLHGRTAFVGGAGDRAHRKRRHERATPPPTWQPGACMPWRRTFAASARRLRCRAYIPGHRLPGSCLRARERGFPDAGGLTSREVITLIQSLAGLPLLRPGRRRGGAAAGCLGGDRLCGIEVHHGVHCRGVREEAR